MTDSTLHSAARRVLEDNWRGDHTVPAGGLYPHQWSWDSAFIAFGLRHLSSARARQELESLLAAQWDDGRLPQIVFNSGVDDAYFPGPRFWRTETIPGTPPMPTAGLVQPPNHAWAVWAVHEAEPRESRREGFLERAYPRLVEWHEYLRNRRNRSGSGLLTAVHPWETGMDNSPAWDAPLSRVPRQCDVELARPDLLHADASERPTAAEYQRYVYLAQRYRDSGCDDADPDFPFLVEDPGMNALWAVSETALAAIASEVGESPSEHEDHAQGIADALQELFDKDAEIYRARDVRTGERLAPITVAGLLPLLVSTVSTHDQLLATLRGPRFRLGEVAMVPSYDLTQPDTDAAAYWRGPAWFNTAWMLWRSLCRLGADEEAAGLAATMKRLALSHDFPEYVDPWTGAPHGTRMFSWTAALALDTDVVKEPSWP